MPATIPAAARDRLRVAMLGSGYMAEKHCAVLARREDVELIRLCSTQRSAVRARELATRFGFSAATGEFEAALGDDVDVVYVCAPDATHPAYVVQALEAGKHVLCEKPLARTADEFAAISAALERSSTTLQVGMNCRFRAQFSGARTRVLDGSLGDIRFLRGTYVQNAVDAVRNRRKPWAADVQPGVSQFLHGGVLHILDIMRWVGGEISSVFALAAGHELADPWGVDTYSVSLTFVDGAIGELLASAGSFRPNDFTLECWLGKGSIVGWSVYGRKGDGPGEAAIPVADGQAVPDLELEFEDFKRAIENSTQPTNSFDEALANFLALDAIERSVASGQRVPVQLVAGVGR